MPQTAEGISGKDLLGLRSLRTQTTIDPEQVYQITLYTNDERLAALREKIQIGLDQADRGETVEMEEVFDGIDKIIDNAKRQET